MPPPRKPAASLASPQLPKAASLRAALETAIPNLTRDPEKFWMIAEQGRITANLAPARGFSWRYKLKLAFEDCRAHPSSVFLVINDWARTQQPDLVATNGPGYAFEAQPMGADTVDLEITLDLSESVTVTVGQDGTAMIAHQTEPNFDALFGDEVTGPPITAIKVIGPCDAEPWLLDDLP